MASSRSTDEKLKELVARGVETEGSNCVNVHTVAKFLLKMRWEDRFKIEDLISEAAKSRDHRIGMGQDNISNITNDFLNRLKKKVELEDEIKTIFLNKETAAQLKKGHNCDDSYDCGEIAEDIQKKTGGDIYRIESSEKGAQINIIEYGDIKKMDYHEVCVHNKRAIDPRMSKDGIRWNKYKAILEQINLCKKITYKKL